MKTPRSALALDGALQNLATGAGSVADPISQVQLFRSQKLTQSEIDGFVEKEWGCAQFVADLPEEATRKGFDLTRARAVDAEDDDDEAARKVQDLLEDLDVTNALREATKWDRQYGGGLIVAHVNDGQDVREPLDLSKRPTLVRLEVRSRYQVEPPQEGDLESDPMSPRYGQPRVWRLLPIAGGKTAVIHASRAYAWTGVRSSTSQHGWCFGDSVLETFIPPWVKYRHSINESLAVVPRLAETRWGIPGLRKMLGEATTAEASSFKRYAGEIAAIRSGLRIAFHDKDETLTDANVQMAGAISLIEKTRENVAGAAKTSVQRFFGLQQQGLSNNDETGAERDDGATVAFQTRQIRPALNWLTEIASAHLGLALDSWLWVPRALREETPASKATRQYTEAQTREIDERVGLVHASEIRAGMRANGDLPYVFSDEYDEMPDPEEIGMLPPHVVDPGQGEDPTTPTVGGPDPALSASTLPDGTQVTAAADIVDRYTKGLLSRPSAMSFLQIMFGLQPAQAAQLLGPETFKPREPEPAKPSAAPPKAG